jgi:uncharacterized alpha-E superfamily protein
MLGSTAKSLFWMFRYLERSENTARLIEAGLRMALTRSTEASDGWESVVRTAGGLDDYRLSERDVDGPEVVDFLLRDRTNPSSVLSVLEAARRNGRTARTALTREVWEATNESWISISRMLDSRVAEQDLPVVLAKVRQESAYVRGALHGTMTRNDTYDFCRLGTFVERADNTARILDVKYYVLLPSASLVGSPLDNAQWENILRSVSAQRAFRWRWPGSISASDIAEFLILDPRMPRSLAFCYAKIDTNLGYLAREYGGESSCHGLAEQLCSRVQNATIGGIFEQGLHEFLTACINDTALLGAQIDADFRFSR